MIAVNISHAVSLVNIVPVVHGVTIGTLSNRDDNVKENID